MRRRRKKQPWLEPENLWHEYEVKYDGEGGIVVASSQDQAHWLAYHNLWHDDPTRNIFWPMLFIEFKKQASVKYLKPHQSSGRKKFSLSVRDYYQCDRCGDRWTDSANAFCPRCKIALKKIRTIETREPDHANQTGSLFDHRDFNPYDRESSRDGQDSPQELN